MHLPSLAQRLTSERNQAAAATHNNTHRFSRRTEIPSVISNLGSGAGLSRPSPARLLGKLRRVHPNEPYAADAPTLNGCHSSRSRHCSAWSAKSLPLIALAHIEIVDPDRLVCRDSVFPPTVNHVDLNTVPCPPIVATDKPISLYEPCLTPSSHQSNRLCRPAVLVCSHREWLPNGSRASVDTLV